MATFVKRGDYQWQAKIRRLGHPIQSKTFNTKAEAEVWARQIEGEMDRGIFVSRTEAENTTLHKGLKRYSEEITPKKKGAKQEQGRIKRWQQSDFAHRNLATLKSSDFAKFRDDCRKAGKAENTIRLDLALISHFFEIARKDWGMESLINPVKNIRLPTGSKPRDRRLEKEEQRYLIDALTQSSQPICAKIALLAIETAMRQSEILGLVWENIDLKKNVAFLPDTKNGDSRKVPLSTKAITVFKSLLPVDENGKTDAGKGNVFEMPQDRLVRVFIRARAAGKVEYLKDCEKTNQVPVEGFLDNIRFHDLRHEATTRLFELGLDMMEVASISGHKSLSMLKRYTHLRAEDLALKLG